MKTESIHDFLIECRGCAIQMMMNAHYILKELPGLNMPDDLREEIVEISNTLIGTKFDLFTEIGKIEELLAHSPSSPRIFDKIKISRDWITSDLAALHAVVQRATRQAEDGSAHHALGFLLMESATNILNSTPSVEMEPEDCAAFDQEEGTEGELMFRFVIEDRLPLKRLCRAVQVVAQRPGFSEQEQDWLKAFAFALERFPLITPGVIGTLILKRTGNRGFSALQVGITSDGFSLERVGWEDGDSVSEILFEVEENCREGDSFAFLHFAEAFAELARDPASEVEIENHADAPFLDWDLPNDPNKWDELPSMED